VRRSTLELATAEAELLTVVRAQCGPREGILAGNSIWQDRRFLVKYVPTLEGYLHYRQVDVTSVKLLARSWFGNAGRFDKPEKTHTALADVYASIDELRFYRQLFSAPQP
jgi:oligoribonuclease